MRASVREFELAPVLEDYSCWEAIPALHRAQAVVSVDEHDPAPV